MEDPTKLDRTSDGVRRSDENKTTIVTKTTGDMKSGDFVAGIVLPGRYRIIALVGKGGMGEVYKAEDIKLSQTVALKFLPESLQNDRAALERFHAEVRNARQVSHRTSVAFSTSARHRGGMSCRWSLSMAMTFRRC